MSNDIVKEVKVSSKYQVVIPKKARTKMGLNGKHGFSMRVKKVTESEITLEKVPDWRDLIGSMPDAWGPNPVAKIRKMRDEEWQ